MNEVKISVIVPAYNVEPYIKKCIDSILNQTFKDYELIIINDGSTDNTGTIIDEYKDSRIKIIHQSNKGLSAARNIGIDLAKGKYITFIDSDDYIDYKYLEILYSLITKYNADIVTCDKILVNKNINTNIIYNYKEEIINKEETYKRMFLNKGIVFSVWSKLYKKELFNNIKFPIGKLYEDIYIINDIIDLTNKIVSTNYNGYYYLKREKSITSSKMTYNHLDLIDSSIKFRDYMLKNYPNLNNYTIRGYIRANYTIYNKAILDKTFKKEYCDIRKEILSYKKDIFSNKIYSKSMKLQTFLLLFGNEVYKLFYKIYKKILNI